MTTPMTTLESFNKCVWDISIDKVPLKDRPYVIDYIESITGLKTLCGRLANEPYRLVWVECGIINGNSRDNRKEIEEYFKNILEPKGYKLTTIDYNLGEL